MFTRNLSIALTVAVALTLATTCPLYAVQTEVSRSNATTCDILSIPADVDEIGDLLIFPAGERLEATTQTVTNTPACIATNDPTTPDERVSIINFSGRNLTDVWYVANNETRISNVDGWANDSAFSVLSPADNEAFRIDSDVSDPGGVHHPLVFESIAANDIWEAGETWDFILQDYSNSLGIFADAINSIGVGDASGAVAGAVVSSGSIIALPQIPEPGSAVLALLGCVGMTFLSRRRGAVCK